MSRGSRKFDLANDRTEVPHADAINVFWALAEFIESPIIHAACADLLSADELDRASVMSNTDAARAFVISHGMLRAALSQTCRKISPRAWRFQKGAFGRPSIAMPAEAESVHFSLSRTEGCVACAISPHRLIGVDIENVARSLPFEAIGEFAFSMQERELLQSTPAGEKASCFFALWTAREAFVKAVGVGLGRDPVQIENVSTGTGPHQPTGVTGVASTGSGWRFRYLAPSATHRLAIADGSAVPDGLPILVRGWPMI